MSTSSDSFEQDDRIIGVIDVDSFECQIWLKKFPKHKGKPCVVADGTGRIVSISAEAKYLGINRKHRVPQARELCPKLFVFTKPNRYNKPDSEETRKASHELTDVITDYLEDVVYYYNIAVEHVPTDQWYFDLTDYVAANNEINSDDYADNIYIENGSRRQEGAERLLGNVVNQEKKDLLCAAFFIKDIIDEIHAKTGFTCSGGVACNLLRAKLACTHNKPNVITALTSGGFDRISPDVPIQKVSGFGGSLGEELMENFNVFWLQEARNLKFKHLERVFSYDEAQEIHDRARGICDYAVEHKLMTRAVNCAKYNLKVFTNKDLRSHLDNLSEEMSGRLQEEMERNEREATSLKIKYEFYNNNDKRNEYSEECTFDYDHSRHSAFHKIAQRCYAAIRYDNGLNFNEKTITSLKITAKNFDDTD